MDDDFPSDLLPTIEKFLQVDHLRQPGRDLYPEVFETGCFPLQRQRELAKMMQEARNIQPNVVMEIGTDKGGGLYHWCKCLQAVERVIACEVRGTPYRDLFQEDFPHIDFLWLEGSSYDLATVRAVWDWLNGDKINCLFIDGDKSAFLNDFGSYLPAMSRPGLAFMHDVQDEAPGEAFNRVCAQGYRHKKIVDTSESEEAQQRAERGEPVTSAYEGWLRHWGGRSCGVGVIYLE